MFCCKQEASNRRQKVASLPCATLMLPTRKSSTPISCWLLQFIIFEVFSVIPALWLPNWLVSEINLSRVRSVSSGLPNPWVYLTEFFWEFYSVISVEEFPNRKCCGISSVIMLCVMVSGTCCICVSCVTLPALEPCPATNPNVLHTLDSGSPILFLGQTRVEG